MWKSSLIAVALLAASLAAGERESLAAIEQRAGAAKPAEQVKLYMQLADRELEAADGYFNQSDFENGKASVNAAAEACAKAGGAARRSGKHLKATEIHVRDVERRLEAIRQSLSFEDRDALKPSIERLEKVRSELLLAMFGTPS